MSKEFDADAARTIVNENTERSLVEIDARIQEEAGKGKFATILRFPIDEYTEQSLMGRGFEVLRKTAITIISWSPKYALGSTE